MQKFKKTHSWQDSREAYYVYECNKNQYVVCILVQALSSICILVVTTMRVESLLTTGMKDLVFH